MMLFLIILKASDIQVVLLTRIRNETLGERLWITTGFRMIITTRRAVNIGKKVPQTQKESERIIEACHSETGGIYSNYN